MMRGPMPPAKLMIDSGWNCTPAIGRLVCSTAITTPSSATAVARSAGRLDIAGERMDERVLAINQQHALAGARAIARRKGFRRDSDDGRCGAGGLGQGDRLE